MSGKDPHSGKDLSQLAREDRFKKLLWWAVGLHVAFLLVAYFGFPHLTEKPFDLAEAVQVDLVAPTAEMSAAPNKSKSNKPFVPKAKPTPVQPPKPPVAKPDKPPETVQSDTAKKEDTPKPVETPPPPKPPEPKVEPLKEATEKAPEEPKPVEKPKEKEKPKPVEKPKKEAPKKSRDDGAGSEAEKKEFNSVLKNLLGDVDAKVETPEGNPVDAPADPDTKVEGKAPVTSDKLALSEMDALKYQLQKCWNVPTGAMDAENLIVEIKIEVNADRTVKTAEIVDQGRYMSDSFFAAAADSARRAVFNPRCSPLELPADKYDVWKTIRIRFDPKEMFGN